MKRQVLLFAFFLAMNNLIVGQITQRYFELIRNRIAIVLSNELEYQDYVSTDPLFIMPTVGIEVKSPVDHTKIPLVTVSLARGTYGNKDVRGTEGTYTYNVDVYTKAKNSTNSDTDIEAVSLKSSDALSSLRLHRLIGMCQAVLDNPVYRTLAFDPPSIKRITVMNMNIAEPTDGDTHSTIMGRLQVEVIAPETNILLTADQINEYRTSVKLALTEQGYIFSLLESETTAGLQLENAAFFLLENGEIMLLG